jgi:hypothetical protein
LHFWYVMKILIYFTLHEKVPLKIFLQGPLWSNFMNVNCDWCEGSHDKEIIRNCSQNKINSLYHKTCNLKLSYYWWRSHCCRYCTVLIGNLLVEEFPLTVLRMQTSGFSDTMVQSTVISMRKSFFFFTLQPPY